MQNKLLYQQKYTLCWKQIITSHLYCVYFIINETVIIFYIYLYIDKAKKLKLIYLKCISSVGQNTCLSRMRSRIRVPYVLRSFKSVRQYAAQHTDCSVSCKSDIFIILLRRSFEQSKIGVKTHSEISTSFGKVMYCVKETITKFGSLTEWSNVLVLKTSVHLGAPQVRILQLPLIAFQKI